MAKEEGDDLSRRCQAWLKVGGDDFVACLACHQALQITKWHEGFQPKEPSREDIRNYQRTNWGTAKGETCVLKLSSLAANNMGVVRNSDSF